MPIKNKALYPENWKAIRRQILARAGDKCEGIEAFPNCQAVNHQPHPETGSKVVLTIAHLDQNPQNNDFNNLRALCQRCHFHHDRKDNLANARITRAKKRRL